MVTSVSAILKDFNVSLDKTPYTYENKAVLDYPLLITEHFMLKPLEDDVQAYAVASDYAKARHAFAQRGEYADRKRMYDELGERIKELKRAPAQERLTAGEEIRNVRAQRKALAREMDALLAEYDMHQAQFSVTDKFILKYKDILYLNTLQNMQKQLPPFTGVQSARLQSMPLFTKDMYALSECYRAGRPIAVEGGPCFFGNDEVELVLTHSDGAEYRYDFNAEHTRLEDGGVGFARHVKAHAPDIVDVRVLSKKDRLTLQEYEAVLYLFELAGCLGAPLVVTVPDFSYAKFLKAALAPLEDGLRESAMEEFRRACGEITHQYALAAEDLAGRYGVKEYILLHAGNEEALAMFYRARKPYIPAGRPVTSNPYKEQAVLDYVFLPAFPFYRWGIRDVLEVNSVYEVDSVHKCAKYHKSAMNLYALMYPEILGKNGRETIFDSARGDKIYV